MLIITPTYLRIESCLRFVNRLVDCVEILSNGKTKDVEVDFSQTKSMDPFTIVYLSSELTAFIVHLKKKGITVTLTNYEHLSYPAHMGFFKSMHIDFGKQPGQAKGGANYIPLTIFEVKDIQREAAENHMHYCEVLEEKARGMANVLCRHSNQYLADSLTFSIREILRNVIEHSDSTQFGFCAQYYPTNGEVRLALIDRGMGIKRSLSTNPHLTINDDFDAVEYAIQPGISGKVYTGQKSKPKGDWRNSGYGLYMTSNICKLGGSFFLASGYGSIQLTPKTTKKFHATIHGTIVSLTLKVNRLFDLNEMLKSFNEETSTDVPASPSSLGLKSKTP